MQAKPHDHSRHGRSYGFHLHATSAAIPANSFACPQLTHTTSHPTSATPPSTAIPRFPSHRRHQPVGSLPCSSHPQTTGDRPLPTHSPSHEPFLSPIAQPRPPTSLRWPPTAPHATRRHRGAASPRNGRLRHSAPVPQPGLTVSQRANSPCWNGHLTVPQSATRCVAKVDTECWNGGHTNEQRHASGVLL